MRWGEEADIGPDSRIRADDGAVGVAPRRFRASASRWRPKFWAYVQLSVQGEGAACAGRQG